MLVQPLAGNLKELLDTSGEGMIYRHCYSTPDIEKAYDELMAAGVQPEDENGKPLARANLQSPSGARIIWLPKRFGHFSIEVLEEKALEAFIEAAFFLKNSAVGKVRLLARALPSKTWLAARTCLCAR
jgi:methylmalonyl-CoA/ethylmalonyl-CoA epimerase